MRIYMDMGQTEQFDITYYGRDSEGKEFVLSISKIIESRRKEGKTYDEKHMEFFRSIGIQKQIRLRYAGLGWFDFVEVA